MYANLGVCYLRCYIEEDLDKRRDIFNLLTKYRYNDF